MAEPPVGENDRTRRINLTDPCDPAAQRTANAIDSGGLGRTSVELVALAVAIIAGGWYWRHTHSHGCVYRSP